MAFNGFPQTPKTIPASFTCYIELASLSVISSVEEIQSFVANCLRYLEDILDLGRKLESTWIRFPSSSCRAIRFVVVEIDDERSLRGSSCAPFYEVPL
jgi:hypothetical protein